jgi:hypothetical protein
MNSKFLVLEFSSSIFEGNHRPESLVKSGAHDPQDTIKINKIAWNTGKYVLSLLK